LSRGIVRRKGQERRTLLPQALQVLYFAVGRACLPTLVDDPDTLKRQGSHGSLMTFAPGPLRHVVGFGPEGMVDGLSSIFMERLPQELRTEVAPADSCRLSTALKHGGYTGEAEQLINCSPPLSYSAHGCREACSIDGAGARAARQTGDHPHACYTAAQSRDQTHGWPQWWSASASLRR
jgi:hypothetical protein